MLPTITQRLMMLVAIIIGTVCWLPILPMLMPADGSTGLSLMDPRSGMVLAIAVLLLAGLPAVLCGLYVSSSGNPLSGLFTIGFCLMILSGKGGSMNGLILRQAEREATDSRGGSIFIQLEIEMVLWAAFWCLFMYLVRQLRLWVRRNTVPRRLKTTFNARLTEEDTPKFVLHVRPAMAGLLCAGLAWVMCRFLIQTHDVGQVIGSLLLAFTLAGLTARLALPTGNVVYLLLSPLLVGFASYAHAAVLQGSVSADELIQRWQLGELTGATVAMPIHWASAGIIGVTVGIGMAQAIDRVRTEESMAREQAAKQNESTTVVQ